MSRSRLEEVLEVAGSGGLRGTLIMGEVLTRRGQTGPLARIWKIRGKRTAEPSENENRRPEPNTADDR